MIKYTTLWEVVMKQVYVKTIADFVDGLANLRGQRSWAETVTVGERREAVSQILKQPWSSKCEGTKADFESMARGLLELDLKCSARTANKLGELVASPSGSVEEVLKVLEELKGRMVDELDETVCFSVSSDKKYLISADSLFGEQVANAFPSAEQDIKHAGNCLAFDEWTASVFHSMRILEIGLTVLAKSLEVNTDRQEWEYLIDHTQNKIKTISEATHGKDWRVDQQFYSEAALQFRYFKNAWRNHVMHVRDTYDEERAETIFRHVKEFMTHLATKLKE